ncbi:hypothetical protein GIY21_00830 [Xanthomonas sontii]|uniref:Uncharacterized protein n=1 Tax=Xanthomonas sontii TaxID=2650745 RepID=A0A6N7QD72_9XANT|nr:hypothetical protein [Xanthomonas sontii]MRG98831.1 hypothetical protein [Xanthomonas sontii]MRH73378.1 hypothetical protein [Xanthomonas sontii]
MEISFYKSVDVEVEVCVDAIDIARQLKRMDPDDRAQFIATALKGAGERSIPFGAGDGDQARIANTIERAFLAAKSLPNCPPEIAELFWVVHQRAMA